jgi:hypothetical protein
MDFAAEMMAFLNVMFDPFRVGFLTLYGFYKHVNPSGSIEKKATLLPVLMPAIDPEGIECL